MQIIAETMKFIPWVYWIYSSMRLYALSTLFKLLRYFFLNNLVGGVLPKSFSICSDTDESICLFFQISFNLYLYYSLVLLLESQYQIFGLSFNGNPSHEASVIFESSTFLLLYNTKIHVFSVIEAEWTGSWFYFINFYSLLH